MRVERDYIGRLMELVDEAISGCPDEERNALLETRHFLGNLKGHLDLMPALQEELEGLRKEVTALAKPPLQYGVFLGKNVECSRNAGDKKAEEESLWDGLDWALSRALAGECSPAEIEKLEASRQRLNEIKAQAASPREVIVGAGGQRLEVTLADPELKIDHLQEGREVVLNKEMNVVGVRNQFQRGETAEVVNVLSPPGTAKVLSIDTERLRLRAQWPDGDRFEASCSRELTERLKRGDIVEIEEVDSQEEEKAYRATGKIRPRLHVRTGGSEGGVVEISDRLFEEAVEIGDIVRLDSRLQFAFEKLPSYETGGLTLEEVPDVTYEDIGGLDKQIEEIRDAIELPYLYRKLFEEYQLARPSGILLHGPPGCGKTMVAKAVANSLTQSIRVHLQRVKRLIELCRFLRRHPEHIRAVRAGEAVPGWDAACSELAVDLPINVPDEEMFNHLDDELRLNEVDPDDLDGTLRRIETALREEDGIRSFFLNVKGPELLDKYVGETEHHIRKVFEEAKRRATFFTPVVIFFDEMEAMFRTRGTGRSSDVETTIVPQFLAEMDGVEASENVVIIGASNRQDLIDPAIMRPGRLDAKIKIDRPTREAAMQIMSLYLTPALPLSHSEATLPAQHAVPAVTFSSKSVERTVGVLSRGQSEHWRKRVMVTIPERCDFRRALARSSELKALSEEEQRVRELVDEAVRREWLAEALIIHTVALLFNPTSRLEAVTGSAKHHSYPLAEFVSGAELASIVSRAKKAAVKRKVMEAEGAQSGITAADLSTALREEYEGSAEQLVANRLAEKAAPHERPESVADVKVHLETEEEDPWSQEKSRPYRQAAS